MYLWNLVKLNRFWQNLQSLEFNISLWNLVKSNRFWQNLQSLEFNIYLCILLSEWLTGKYEVACAWNSVNAVKTKNSYHESTRVPFLEQKRTKSSDLITHFLINVTKSQFSSEKIVSRVRVWTREQPLTCLGVSSPLSSPSWSMTGACWASSPRSSATSFIVLQQHTNRTWATGANMWLSGATSSGPRLPPSSSCRSAEICQSRTTENKISGFYPFCKP